MRIYLDHAATTPIDSEVWAGINQMALEVYGNPSSIHTEGRKARNLIEEARKIIAGHVKCSQGELFFTSCGTEANNMILTGAVRDLKVKRIFTSPVEHHCILHHIEYLKHQYDVEIIWLPLDVDGTVAPPALEEVLQRYPDRPALVSLMHVNNEIGSMHDLQVIGDICHRYNTLYHSDTVQSVGYHPLDMSTLPVDFISGSAHKFNGPKGVGFAVISNEFTIAPLLYGGAQERNMRAGTENTLGIHGMGIALHKAISSMDDRQQHMQSLRTYFAEAIRKIIPDAYFNGRNDTLQSSKILSANLPLTSKSSMLLMNLDIAGIAASGGSACSSGVESRSHVLAKLQVPDDFVTVRFSFSGNTTFEELDHVLSVIRQIYS